MGSKTRAAEYRGTDLDGESFSCTAFSYSTSRIYDALCEFSGGDEVIIHFPNGGSLTVAMDDEEIEDASAISAFDYRTSTFWDLDVKL